VEYAKARGIEVGAYDLIGWTRNPGEKWMAKSGLKDGAGACWASGWADFLLNRTLTMKRATGLSMVETDGPYAGYSCTAEDHVHHHGVADSVYEQVQRQAEYYRELRNEGVFINAPDFW
jgi:hypothetical protein